MAKAGYKSVDAYLAAQPEPARKVLAQVRNALRRALPKAEEVISYQIPAYRLPGGVVLFFAGWKEHYSLYPATTRVTSELKDELEPYEVRKGTIRFPLSQRVPLRLIGRIARLRATETTEREEAKKVARKAVAVKRRTAAARAPRSRP